MTADQFRDLAERSGLVDKGVLDAAIEDFIKATTIGLQDDAVALSEFCIERGILTRWQVSMLLLKKFKGFIIGNYRLLERYADPNLFRAQHIATREKVDILSLPRSSYFVVMKPNAFVELLT